MSEYIANIIHWQSAAATYLFGSSVTFKKNAQVVFKNDLMSPGKAINTWYSRTNYQAHRFSPQLPLLKKKVKYRLLLEAKSQPVGTVYLRLNFFGRTDKLIGQVFIKDRTGVFEYPENAYYYEIALLNAGCQQVTFDYIKLATSSLSNTNANVSFSEQLNQSACNTGNIIFEEPVLNAVAELDNKVLGNLKNCFIVNCIKKQSDLVLSAAVMKKIKKLSASFEHINFWGMGPSSNYCAAFYRHYLKNASAFVTTEVLPTADYQHYMQASAKMHKTANLLTNDGRLKGAQIYENSVNESALALCGPLLEGAPILEDYLAKTGGKISD